MRHVLNNTATPSLQTFTDIAIPIGVIESNIADPQPWIMSNFIGLHFRFSWTQIVFDVPPFYKWDCFESKCIRIDRHNQQQFTRLIREQLIDNHYIYMFANEFYIPIRNTYHKRKTNHDLCIYGFDDEKQIFFVSAYDTHHYSLQTIAYEDLYLSFLYYTASIYHIYTTSRPLHTIYRKLFYSTKLTDHHLSSLSATSHSQQPAAPNNSLRRHLQGL